MTSQPPHLYSQTGQPQGGGMSHGSEHYQRLRSGTSTSWPYPPTTEMRRQTVGLTPESSFSNAATTRGANPSEPTVDKSFTFIKIQRIRRERTHRVYLLYRESFTASFGPRRPNFYGSVFPTPWILPRIRGEGKLGRWPRGSRFKTGKWTSLFFSETNPPSD